MPREIEPTKTMSDEIEVYPAADQDGYDGGFVATDGTIEAWADTKERAKLELSKMKARDTVNTPNR